MAMKEKKEDYRLAAIMFTDIYGFSRMMEKNERKMLALLNEHNSIIEKLVKQHNGHVIKTIGDAYLVDFNNTVHAVQCGVDIQKALHDFNINRPFEEQLFLRIGVHLGDIWFFENDALGEGINIASRLQGLARPGRIVISHDVYNLVFNKLDIEIFSLGKAKLKNITKEIFAYEIPTEASADFTKVHPEALDFHDEKSGIEEPQPGRHARHANKPVDPATSSSESEQDFQSQIIAKLKNVGTRMKKSKLQLMFQKIPRGTFDDMMRKLADEGIVTRVETPEGQVEFGLGDFRFSRKHGPEKPVAQTAGRRKRKLDRMIGSTFGAVLFLIGGFFLCSWAETEYTPGIHWARFVLLGWSAAVLAKIATVFIPIIQRNQLNRLPDDITEEQWGILRKLQRTRIGWVLHFRSWVSAGGWMYILACILSAEFLKTVTAFHALVFITTHSAWKMVMSNPYYKMFSPLVPTAFAVILAVWGIGLLVHLGAVIGRSHSLKHDLEDTDFSFRSHLESMDAEE